MMFGQTSSYILSPETSRTAVSHGERAHDLQNLHELQSSESPAEAFIRFSEEEKKNKKRWSKERGERGERSGAISSR